MNNENPDLKRTINWNKCQSKRSIERQNSYLYYLVDPSFQGVNGIFALTFEDNEVREKHRRHFLPTVEIKDQIVTIDGEKKLIS